MPASERAFGMQCFPGTIPRNPKYTVLLAAVIVESISVVDGLGLPKRPFKKKLLKYDYRIETPSFESA